MLGKGKKRRLYTFKPFVFKKCPLAKGTKVPKPRSGHRVVCDDVALYCYGGYNPDICGWEMANDDNWRLTRPLFRELWKFNFAKKKWVRLNVQNIPLHLASSAVMLEGKLLTVYGGTGIPFGKFNSNVMSFCDLSGSNLAFKELTVSGNPPEPRYGAAFFRKNHFLYVIGGTTGQKYSSEVSRLNLLEKTWESVTQNKKITNAPPGRYRHELCILGSKVYVLGGGTALDTFGFEELFVYDIETNGWSVVTTYGDHNFADPYPKPRKFHSANLVPNTQLVVMLGGLDGNTALNDCWILNLETFRWKNITSLKLPNPTYFHDSCVTPGGKLYVFGGAYEEGGKTLRSSHFYTAWCCIPKLKEICWEAVLHYNILKNQNQWMPLEFQARLQI